MYFDDTRDIQVGDSGRVPAPMFWPKECVQKNKDASMEKQPQGKARVFEP